MFHSFLTELNNFFFFNFVGPDIVPVRCCLLVLVNIMACSIKFQPNEENSAKSFKIFFLFSGKDLHFGVGVNFPYYSVVIM